MVEVIEQHIGITDLVHHTKKSGDLNFSTSTYGRNRKQEGIILHSKLQGERPKTYKKEHAVKKAVAFESGTLLVRGRIDGIDFTQDPVLIEEIKSHVCDYQDISPNQKDLHWAQLLCYGYLICNEKPELNCVMLHLSYIHADTEEVVTEEKEVLKEDLILFWKEITQSFWASVMKNHNRVVVRNQQLIDQDFPQKTFRTGQRALAAQVFRGLKNKETRFIQAPTGLGKTIGNLFPALKLMGQGEIDQIFFLTAKNTGKETAEKACGSMISGNDALTSLEITAKSKTCFNPELPCDPEECQYARGYFDKIEDVIDDMQSKVQHYGRDQIEHFAEKHTICPFELSLDLIEHADVVVADYNYAFDPKAQLKRVFGEEVNKDVVLLIDEAHNFLGRAREMFSAALEETSIIIAKRIWAEEADELRNPYNAVLRAIKKLKTACQDSGEQHLLTEHPDELTNALRRLNHSIEVWLAENPGHSRQQELLEQFFLHLDFLRISEMYSDNYTTLLGIDYQGEFTIKLLCLDVSSNVKHTVDQLKGAIFFSATLAPLDFYTTSILSPDIQGSLFPSPFPEENLCVVAATHLATTYKKREETLPAVVTTTFKAMEGKVGNYLVFCPSYAYMEKYVDQFMDYIAHNELDYDVLVQGRKMDDRDKSAFLKNFEESPERSNVGIVVGGGVFGEGVDLVGDRLIGAIIIGVGLPMMNPETNAISNYYQSKYNRGFEFAYQFPGMNQVLQNAGRVIRTAEDTGIICLIDQRFSRGDYQRMLPPYWNVKTARSENDVANHISNFWKTKTPSE